MNKVLAIGGVLFVLFDVLFVLLNKNVGIIEWVVLIIINLFFFGLTIYNTRRKK
jgi:hypothetical protein